MLFHRLAAPRANAFAAAHSLLESALSSPLSCQSVRHASHGAAGRANGPKNGPGKRLGAKKTGDEYVIPGNIIFRQRGTEWHPGANVGRGRDHTIYALEEGYVKYYRDPTLHPKRRYIGVVLNRTDTLPEHHNAPRRRRLNMVAVPRQQTDDELIDASTEIGTLPGTAGDGIAVAQTPPERPVMSKRRLREDRRKMKQGRQPVEELTMRDNYSFRESNWSIGRSAERAGIQVEKFKPGDRFKAWQKTAVRRKRRAEKMQIGRKKPSSRQGKGKPKGRK